MEINVLDDGVRCPKCDKAMFNIGNLDATVMLSDPPKWKNTWACHDCKIFITKYVTGYSSKYADIIKNYEEVEEIETPIQKKRREMREKCT